MKIRVIPARRCVSCVVWALGWCALGGCNREPVPIQGSPLWESSVDAADRGDGLEIVAHRSAPLSSVDWPALFGPDGTSLSQEQRIDARWDATGPRELWRAAIGRGYSSPVIAEGKLLLHERTGDEERLRCWDARTGEELWHNSRPTTYQCKFPPYTSGPYGTPLIHGGRVYAASAQAQLECCDLETGSTLWQRDLREDYQIPEGQFGFGPGLMIDGELLFLNAGGTKTNAGIIALRIESGETAWTATDHASAYTTPRVATVDGKRHLLVLTETGLADLVPDSGQVRWVYPFHSKAVDTINAVSPVVQDDLVMLVTGPGPGAVCLRLQLDGSFSEVWKDRRLLDSQFNNLLVANGFVYGFTASRQGGATFRCCELKSGQLRWEHKSLLGRGSSLAADGQIIMLGEQGHLAALALDSTAARVISPCTPPLLESPCYSSPALSGGRLYLRNETAVVCYDLRSGP